MGTENLREMELWRLWKAAVETTRARILEDANASSGLSDADLVVLFRVADAGAGAARQRELAASLRWHRSRLSHQLTRMEQRGLLRRERVDGGVTVSLTQQGKEAFDAVRPDFIAAVRRHFVDLIPAEHEHSFRAVLERLVEGCPAGGSDSPRARLSGRSKS